MKYFLLFKNTNNKTCSLENRNSYIFRKQYYNNELFNTAESIEISFSKDAANKFLPLKNIIVIHGLNDSFVVDEYTMELLQSHFSDCLSFIKTEVINDDEYKNLKFYILYFKCLMSGLNEEKSEINFRVDDKFIVEKEIEFPDVFKFKNYKMLTFESETFKAFVEENNIEGWIFREAFEK